MKRNVKPFTIATAIVMSTWLLFGSAIQTVVYQVVESAGTPVASRAKLNFINGSNITIGVVDNAGTKATDVTITASGATSNLTANAPWICVPASASGTAYTCTPTLLDGTAIPLANRQTPAEGQVLIFVPDVNNTGAVTITIDGVNARTARWNGAGADTAFVANDLTSLQPYIFNWKQSNSRWILATTFIGTGDGTTITNTAGLFASFSVLSTTGIPIAGIISSGTKFTISGCSAGTTVGGATAGTFASGTTGICTVVITMNGATGLTAPTGWACDAADRTTAADLMTQTASSTTTATMSGTTVSGDVISFKCIGY